MIAGYRRTRRPSVGWFGLMVGGNLVLSLHSSNELGELSLSTVLPLRAPKRWLSSSYYYQCITSVRNISTTTNMLTFLTVLSGSRAMSGTFASTISENRFSIKLADLQDITEQLKALQSSSKLAHTSL